ncbi:MAG: pyridoxamine 5'-phosphate oxidase family protein [Actinomycetota bacterium]
MSLTAEQREFLDKNRSAAMITVGGDGMPKAVRVGVALVDGKIWSSGTQERERTRRLRRDPRCTLFVFEPGWNALTLETTVELLEGDAVADQSVRLFRVMQARPEGPLMWFGKELDEDAFRQAMIEGRRLIYEFHVNKAYGLP